MNDYERFQKGQESDLSKQYFQYEQLKWWLKMTSKELQEKALEVAQLEWWLANPGLESLWFDVDSYFGVDDNHYKRDYGYDTDKPIEKAYPVALDLEHGCFRVKRPYQTDAEIQARIDHILSFDGVA
ncbi:MAG: hypothetical protein IM613_12435 [Cytophagales bacterium]|jgi:hypothetical protein|nr:hypothetical protein [Cytophagales bacterium]